MIPHVVFYAIFDHKIILYAFKNQTKLNDGFNPDTIINRSKAMFLTIAERPKKWTFRALLTKLNMPIVNIEIKTFLFP